MENQVREGIQSIFIFKTLGLNKNKGFWAYNCKLTPLTRTLKGALFDWKYRLRPRFHSLNENTGSGLVFTPWLRIPAQASFSLIDWEYRLRPRFHSLTENTGSGLVFTLWLRKPAQASFSLIDWEYRLRPRFHSLTENTGSGLIFTLSGHAVFSILTSLFNNCCPGFWPPFCWEPRAKDIKLQHFVLKTSFVHCLYMYTVQN